MKDADPVIAKARAERRRYRRVRIDLPGRLFIPNEEREARCKVVDMSPGGASVECEASPQPDSQIVLYIDGFGRFEGTVVRRDGYGFGLRFASTMMKRERTAEQLTLHLNKA